MNSADYVTLLYQKLLGRSPDSDGLQFYAKLLDDGGDLRLIVNALTDSDEYRALNSIEVVDDRALIAELGRDLVIVDVGAQSLANEAHVYSSLISDEVPWRCIGFEPLEHERTMRLEQEGDPRLTMLDAFIGDGGQHVFHELTDSGSSSLLEPNFDFMKPFEDVGTFREVRRSQAKTSTLDVMLKDERVIDFLKFDIQGFELAAMKASPDILKRTNVIHCETLLGPLYKGQGYFSDIEILLRHSGFEFIDFTHTARYRYMDVPTPSRIGERMLWADAVFFRTLDNKTGTRADFTAQALIAQRVYKKFGLAQSVLQARDRLAVGS